MGFITQPRNTIAATSIPLFKVAIQDANNVTVTTSTAAVTVALGANPASGTLTGVVTRSAVGGIATFRNLKIDNIGTGYDLTASSPGLAGATSTSFDITTVPLTATVTVSNNLFTQNSVLIQAGGSVTWTWAANASGHSVTSDNGAFTSTTGLQNAPFSHTALFPNPGKFRYHCTAHGSPGGGGMSGTVNVQ